MAASPCQSAVWTAAGGSASFYEQGTFNGAPAEQCINASPATGSCSCPPGTRCRRDQDSLAALVHRVVGASRCTETPAGLKPTIGEYGGLRRDQLFTQVAQPFTVRPLPEPTTCRHSLKPAPTCCSARQYAPRYCAPEGIGKPSKNRQRSLDLSPRHGSYMH